MRLIDADSINPADVIGGASEFATDIRKAMQDLIDSQPTAFDPNKIVGQLKNEESGLTTWGEDEAYKLGIEKAIKLIRSGVIADKVQEAAGTEEVTDQEREIKRVISYIRSCRDAGIDTTITIDKTRNHLILNALEELGQYRNLGTVRELKELKESSLSGIELAEIACAMQELKKYMAIGTVEECREGRERQQARKGPIK